jgi:alkylation response protein AidB-like acyl-CoA dehydrogenase
VLDRPYRTPGKTVYEWMVESFRKLEAMPVGSREAAAFAEKLRAEIRSEVAALKAIPGEDRKAAIAEGGWVLPYLPQPWGRAATPVEQIVISQEFSTGRVKRPNMGIAAWLIPSIVAYGTEEQKQRFLPPTFRGEIIWCQLFSEPGAGSDLASLTTKATKVDGGWRITGRKVFASGAPAGDLLMTGAIAEEEGEEPAVLHFGIPMTGAVLNTLNTRLDAEAIAFMLQHGEAKVLLTDREFSKVVAPALAMLGSAAPLVVEVEDKQVQPMEQLQLVVQALLYFPYQLLTIQVP